MTQDALEIFFAAIRQKWGYNVNSPARIFRMTFRSNIINCLIKAVDSEKYEETVDTNLYLENTCTPILGSVENYTSPITAQKQEDSCSNWQEFHLKEGHVDQMIKKKI